MADLPEFEDAKGLEAWLTVKPADWAQAIAVRNALRVFPLVFPIINNPDNDLSQGLMQGLIVSAWRANFLSWAACKYGIEVGTFAFYAAKAASAAAVSVRTVSASAWVGSAASAASAAAISSTNRTGSAATVASNSTAFSDNMAEFWESIRADCQHFLDEKDDLIAQPLWLVDVRGNPDYRANCPEWVREPFDKFADAESTRSTKWSLIIEWYRALLPNNKNAMPRSFFGKSADIEIAMQPDEFWDREPDEVMEAIAEIVRRGSTEQIGSHRKGESGDVVSNHTNNRSKIDAKAVGRALHDNRQPLLFSLASLQQQIAEFRERIRGDNQLELDFKNELLGFLDGLNESLEELAELVPQKGDEPVSVENASAAASWLVLYKARVLEGLKDYCAPENVAETTLPVGVILGCGTVGALVAGPVGFGAGAFFGQLVVRHAKPGTVGDKLKEAIEAESDDPSQE